MIRGQRLTVVLPAYNAAGTLARTVADLDREVIDDVILVDDASTDTTADTARALGLDTVVHPANRGYGGNQKTCYRSALARGADIVVMVHPDYQYSPRLVVPMAAMIAYDVYDVVLGSRILAQNAVDAGMPRYKFAANRALTAFENILVAGKFSEYHTGLRAYRADLLEHLPLQRNSNDFVFDNEILLQALAAGARIGELSCPARYAADSSSIGLGRSVRYGVGVVRASLQYRLHRGGHRRFSYLNVDPFVRAPAAGRDIGPGPERG